MSTEQVAEDDFMSSVTESDFSGDDYQDDYTSTHGLRDLSAEEQIACILDREVRGREYLRRRATIGRDLFEQCHAVFPLVLGRAEQGRVTATPTTFTQTAFSLQNCESMGWSTQEEFSSRLQTEMYMEIFHRLCGAFQSESDFAGIDIDYMAHFNQRLRWIHPGITGGSFDAASPAQPVIECIYPHLIVGHGFQNPQVPVLQSEATHVVQQEDRDLLCWDDLAFAQWQGNYQLYNIGSLLPPSWILMQSISSIADVRLINNFLGSNYQRWPGKTYSAGTRRFEALLATAAGKANINLMLSKKSLSCWENRTCVSITAFRHSTDRSPCLLFHWTDRSEAIREAQERNAGRSLEVDLGERRFEARDSHSGHVHMRLRRQMADGSFEVLGPNVNAAI